MAYCIEAVTGYINLAKNRIMDEAAMWMDVLGGKYPIICDSAGNLLGVHTLVVVKSGFAMRNVQGMLQTTEVCDGYSLTIRAETPADSGIFDYMTSTGAYVKTIGTGKDPLSAELVAHNMFDVMCVGTGMKRRYEVDYGLVDLRGISEGIVSVDLYTSVSYT